MCEAVTIRTTACRVAVSAATLSSDGRYFTADCECRLRSLDPFVFNYIFNFHFMCHTDTVLILDTVASQGKVILSTGITTYMYNQ